MSSKEIIDFIKSNGGDVRKVTCALRLALTGKADGLPIDILLNTLGPEEVKKRINYAIEHIKRDGI